MVHYGGGVDGTATPSQQGAAQPLKNVESPAEVKTVLLAGMTLFVGGDGQGGYCIKSFVDVLKPNAFCGPPSLSISSLLLTGVSQMPFICQRSIDVLHRLTT